MEKYVTLSFDDGPDAETTHVVLDVLKKHNIKSSFFAICSKLEDPEARDAAERAVREGHWYGSHSHMHKTPMGWMENFEDAIPEIDLGFEALGALANPEIMYRPYGFGGVLDTRLLNTVAVDHLLEKKYKCVLWDFTPREWKNVDSWVDMCVDHCEGKEWTCLALRDSEKTIGAQLDALIVKLKEKGFQIKQAFPDHIVPIADGKILQNIEGYVAKKETRQA
ncbi:polysaccharide deacetylase family protein [Glaciimonas sp. Gout2]|uniref:polysaccharide deacetylase family protein n=1 Tax=unclassified Glaciimonas TaxID=2644401 RepID=UPI002AB436A1|nr:MULTISPECIES: polysaccharide deacetylase family protein [unclassified Glaciimonas]MDY7548932.1 polysaccharide deacetylase family protein [Glaciimonas sp. CA11.2]MEB0013630.1 polysaccharide deacetylase family protein [Glaciimonas sp. Cout2]MEB0083656.1 polysaccharide deacetylase family protein [Glaciimonas sp. Gout2]